jgi:D-3-phosphoglycerate dehydrogenase
MKFIITDYIEDNLDFEQDTADALGIEFEYYQLKQASQKKLISTIKGADVILVNMVPFTAEVIDQLDNCRIILRHGIGYDNVDVEAATRAGIVVANYPTYCRQDVAEQAITLMMACQRKLPLQQELLYRSVETKKWIFKDIYPVYRMKGQKVGIIGFGRIGSTVYRMLTGFGVEFLINDPYLSDERVQKFGIVLDSFEDVISQADIVTIHCPLKREETYHMFDELQFKLMKEKAILINTARGGIVNLEALDAALRSGEIGAAGIDVYEQEPPGEALAILTNPKAICTPHLSWLSEEAGWDIRRDYLDDVRRFLDGKPPKNILNPEVKFRL